MRVVSGKLRIYVSENFAKRSTKNGPEEKGILNLEGNRMLGMFVFILFPLVRNCLVIAIFNIFK